MTEAMQAFVVDVMGPFFVEPPTFDLKGCYEDSSVTMPLIFVLSTGSDPNKVRGACTKAHTFGLSRFYTLQDTTFQATARSLNPVAKTPTPHSCDTLHTSDR